MAALRVVSAVAMLSILAASKDQAMKLSLRARANTSRPEWMYDQGDEHRMYDSFGRALTPPCAGITCPHLECVAPLELKQDGTCCGYCWAPDHVVAPMYRSPLDGPSEFVTDKRCPEAPRHCLGAKCFKPNCPVGMEPRCDTGACCFSCLPEGFTVAHFTEDHSNQAGIDKRYEEAQRVGLD